MKVSAVAQLVEGPFDEGKVKAVAQQLRAQLGQKPSVAFVFTTEDYQDHWEDFSETLRVHGHVPTLIGATSTGIVGTGAEVEGGRGFSVVLMHLPESKVKVRQVSAEMVEESSTPRDWHEGNDHQELPKVWLACMECVRFPVESWLQQWNEAYPGVPMLGGLISGESKLYLNEESVSGGLLVGLYGDVPVQTIVSQGCKPIGHSFTVTAVEHNVLQTLGSLPAYQVLNAAFETLTPQEKERAKGNLFAGLAMSEYVEEFKRGDFLVRHILGADPATGAVALGAMPRVGQTLQYQLRDAKAATEELQALLLQAVAQRKEPRPGAGLLFTCGGRGKGLFGVPHHDAGLVDRFFPELPVAGFFAAGEIGPVGARNFIHGYTASIGLIG